MPKYPPSRRDRPVLSTRLLEAQCVEPQHANNSPAVSSLPALFRRRSLPRPFDSADDGDQATPAGMPALPSVFSAVPTTPETPSQLPRQTPHARRPFGPRRGSRRRSSTLPADGADEGEVAAHRAPDPHLGRAFLQIVAQHE